MAACDQCYQCSPVCEHGANAAVACKFFCPDAAAHRTPNGDYDQNFRTTLSLETSNTDGMHLDNLINFSQASATPEVLTTEEQNIVDDLTTITLANIGVAVSVAEKRPGKVKEIRQKIRQLNSGTPTAAQIQLVSANLIELAHVEAQATKDTKDGAVTTTTAYQQLNYPLATLFQNIVKSVQKGSDTGQAAHEMLDPQTGKKYVPFEKATKVTSDVNLMHASHIFVTTVQLVKKEAPSVYYQFSREIKRACEHGGFLFAQKYADAMLKVLDEGVYGNPIVFFQSGEHVRIYTELWSQRAIVPGNTGKLRPDGGQEYIKFGPVTKPMGGEGAGVIKDKNGAKIKCNRFHASPQKACTAGIPAGDPRFTTSQVGLCAYCH